MGYEMDVSFEGDFLCVRVVAQDNYETSLKFFSEIKEACDKHNCLNILVLSNSTPLSTMDAFEHAEIFKKLGFTMKYSIAMVEANPEARKVDRFIENVLTNRSIIRARVFSDESEARQWLLGDHNGN